ncbi:phage baseplate assembly protein V [Paraburkholderia sp. BR14320]|uniref:phage baseplate assembly protein V n=1 Tax=unclassified Paraburkholderia TaxID=2615204 RepID=UPI0034CEBE6E
MNEIAERVFRRVQMMFWRARVLSVDDSATVQQMQVKLNDLETADRVRLAEFGLTSNPPAGSDVLLLHVAGDRTAGVVFASNHQPSRPKGLAPGETMLYCQDGKSVYLTAAGGIVIDAKGQDVTVNDAGNVTCNCSGVYKVVAPGGVQFDTPLVSSTGDIQDNSGSNTKTMESMRKTYDGHNHNVTNVQGGSSTVVTNPPNQPE